MIWLSNSRISVETVHVNDDGEWCDLAIIGLEIWENDNLDQVKSGSHHCTRHTQTWGVIKFHVELMAHWCYA